MNKLFLFILIALNFSCTNSTKENTDENNKPVSSYTVKSKVVPYYLPDGSYHYLDNGYEFIEQFDSSGFPQKLLVTDEGSELIEIIYKYKNTGQLDKFTEINKKGNDTIVYTMDYSGDHVVSKWISSSGTSYTHDEFVFNTSNQLVERFQLPIQSTRIYLVNTFDKSGRVISSIRLADEGLDTRVCYQKYTYPDTKRIWNKREVWSIEKIYDTEDINEGKIDLKNEVLVFPKDFDTAKKVFTDTREVIKD